MAKRARQRISYVLERADKQVGGHIKGVNSLAVDRERSILYSGGRDGILCAWDLNLDLSGNPSSATDSTSAADPARNTTKFRTQHLAHTNWICDLALVQNNEAVVTASQDQLVKLWRPHADQAEEPYKIGEHADYAKCVASPNSNATWVATGGLDRKVYVWDLNGGGKTQEIDTRGEEKPEKGSIYSLSATENVLAYGGLESILHLWDTRSGKRITKFRGHTGLVRSILLSASGDTVMTGSSDQTVKIWSVTAGRCMHTLTMHNESVFSLYSEEPDLSVFYSADRSGLVVKTDIRDVEVDDGLALAVAHEHDIVNKLVAAGDHIWTATQRSSINRWQNVDTRAEIALPESFKQHRASVSSNAPPSINGETPDANHKKISNKSILRISNTARFPVVEPEVDPQAPQPVNTVEPMRHIPQETIEGQFGLVKHRLLADKRRVLTLDTAGDVLLWDLIQCKPIQSFGKKHLEDVEPLVNTLENVSPWCSVDTSSGNLTVILEPFNCFDAEMYADELELEEPLEFRDDQRINYGKWILRYLFANLLDEEIKRDEAYREKLNEAVEARIKARPAPTIQIPSNINFESAVESPLISRVNGPQFALGTPGAMGIGLATPVLPGLRDEGVGPGSPLDKRGSAQANDREDYFSNAINAVNSGQPAKPAAAAATATPAEGEDKTAKSEDGKDAAEKEKEKEKSDKTPFGKKFRMGMSFGAKKLGRSGSATVVDKPAVTEEKSAESESSSNHEPEKEFEDNFLGVIQKIQNEYEKQVAESPQKHVETKIAPSLPNETPILNIPPGTKVIIQEETSGGSAEMYRGTVESIGADANDIEKCAPQWLGEVLLLNTTPQKDPVKVSFVLHPYPGSDLPVLASADGNNRLNANRMLRVKKILAYVAERIDPTMAPTEVAEGDEEKPEPDPDPDALKPEEYLELYCNEQLLPISMTLATLRAYIWKGGNDVVLYYKDNGKKEIPRAAPEAPPTTTAAGEEETSANADNAGDSQPAAGV